MIAYVLSEDAELELIHAIAFYDAESSNLSESFVAEIEQAISYIRTFPQAGTPSGELIRRVRLNRFPYSLVYLFSAHLATFRGI